jgi:hypothetical protein
MKMSLVSTSSRRMAGTPKSDIVYSATSRAPAAAAGLTWRSVTVANTCHWPRPSDRATSSSAGSARCSMAATGSSTYG